MNVHQEEDDSGLQVAINIVDHDPFSDIDNLDIRKRRLFDCLVRLFMLCDTGPVVC